MPHTITQNLFSQLGAIQAVVYGIGVSSGNVYAFNTDENGNLCVAGTAANLPVVDAATGLSGTTAPLFATQIAFQNAGGVLEAVSPTNPLPVTGGGGGGTGGSVTQGTSPWVVSGTVAVTGAYQATQPVSIASSVAVTGTFFQATQPVSIASMPTTPVTGTFWQSTQPVSLAATVTTSDTNLVAQASTTSGQKGPLVQGAVTTSAPTYTTAQTSPLSLDTAGNLRVAGTFAAGALPDLTSAISLTTLGTTASITLAGRNSASFILTSVGTGGQVIAEGSIDGANWFTIDVWSEGLETWIAGGAAITVTGQWWFEPLGALNSVRVRVSTAPSAGSITGNLLASATVMGTFEYQTSPGQAVAPNIVSIGGSVTTAAPTYTTGTANSLSLDAAGNLRTLSRIVGNTGATVDAAITSGAAPPNAVWVTHAPATVPTSSLTPKFINVTAATNLKAAAGSLYGLQLINLATTTATTASLVQYIHFFDTSNATLSTANWKFALPLSGNPVNVIGTGAGPALSIPPGAFALANFANGISIVVNTTSTSNTTAAGTAPAGTIWLL